MELALFYVIAMVSSLRASDRYIDVGITVLNNSPIALIDSKFVGVTLDSHLLPSPQAWDGLNLSSEKVQLLAKALAPCYLRIGGTSADYLTFDPTGHNPDVSHTFTGSTWDTINEFVQTVGWNLIFGLNALERKAGQWDPTNSLEFLHYSTEKQYRLTGLELGNEPDLFPATFNINGSQLGRDFKSFKTIIGKLPWFESTFVIGPDMARVTGTSTQFLADFFTGGGRAVNIITFHHYYMSGLVANISTFTDPEVMDQLIEVIGTAQNVSRMKDPITPMWLGETSSCSHGGAPGLSDTYVAGFLWLDKLGIAAKMGLLAVLRQSFYGGHYSLIKADTFDPLPDYWLTLLYKRLVGSLVLKADSNSTLVRTYAHCTSKANPYGYDTGSVIFYVLVTCNETVKLTIPQFKDQHVHVFWLEPLGDLTSQTMVLNGLPLEMSNNTLPELQPVSSTEDKLYLPGKTFGFIVFPNANLGICIT